jgi:predicted amidophosphoribosyltransferase
MTKTLTCDICMCSYTYDTCEECGKALAYVCQECHAEIEHGKTPDVVFRPAWGAAPEKHLPW